MTECLIYRIGYNEKEKEVKKKSCRCEICPESLDKK